MIIPSIIKYLPWLISTITIYQMYIIGNKNRIGWMIGLFNQILWIIWIILSQSYGLIPLNIAMWIMCIRNYKKWK